MQYQRLAVFLLVLLAIPAGARPQRVPLAQRWFYLNPNHHALDPARIDADILLLRRAAAAGYNGAILEDLDLGLLDRMPPTYVPNLQRLAAAATQAGIELVPQVAVPYGERVLKHNPSLAEGLAVTGATFVVRAGRLELEPDRPHVEGGGARVIPHRAYRVTAAVPVQVTDAS